LHDHGTPESTRFLLRILETIESNVDPEDKSNTFAGKKTEKKRKMESINSRIPKRQKRQGTWSEKQGSLCQEHGGLYKTQDTHDCKMWNPDGSLVKNKHDSKKGKSNYSDKSPKGANFAQIISKECKKAVCSALKRIKSFFMTKMTVIVTLIPIDREGLLAQGS
jgi:hypothetical protein